MSNAFAHKYENLKRFHQALLDNKDKIDELVDHYFEYVHENIVDSEDVDENLLAVFKFRNAKSLAKQRTAAKLARM